MLLINQKDFKVQKNLLLEEGLKVELKELIDYNLNSFKI